MNNWLGALKILVILFFSASTLADDHNHIKVNFSEVVNGYWLTVLYYQAPADNAHVRVETGILDKDFTTDNQGIIFIPKTQSIKGGEQVKVTVKGHSGQTHSTMVTLPDN